MDVVRKRDSRMDRLLIGIMGGVYWDGRGNIRNEGVQHQKSTMLTLLGPCSRYQSLSITWSANPLMFDPNTAASYPAWMLLNGIILT